ncbi:MAG: signal peptidase I [Acidobacteria bacterium]|nr:signal peptidase I [Acidobacteriota bacterium]
MLSLKQKDQPDFGIVSEKDDAGIVIHKVRNASKQGLWTESLRLIRDIILIVAVFVLFGVFIAQPVVVEGTSMVPQLENGERLIVNKLVYYNFKGVGWGHLNRGDIVVFWYPEDPDKSFVKRIIGLPGEMVEVRDGMVLINDKPLKESYLTKIERDQMNDFEPLLVDKHHYFVMGDNRGNSLDSRDWGLVPEKYIYGKAFFRYWRPSKFGFLDHGTTKFEGEGEKPADNRPKKPELDEDSRADR